MAKTKADLEKIIKELKKEIGELKKSNSIPTGNADEKFLNFKTFLDQPLYHSVPYKNQILLRVKQLLES